MVYRARRLSTSGLLPALTLLAAATSANAQTISPPPPGLGGSDDASISVVRDATDRMTVAVEVNGHGPFDFMIDTGAEKTIVSRQLSARVGLPGGAGRMVRSVLGVRATPTAHVERLRVSNRTININDSPVLDAGHIGADGILGLDTLSRQRVTFDFKRDEIRVSPSSLRTDESEDVSSDDSVERVAVPARVRRGNLVLANTSIRNNNVPVVIDTGADVSIGNSQLRRLLNYYEPSGVGVGKVAPQFFATLQSVTGQSGEVEVMLIERLVIDGIEMKNLLVAFVPTSLFKHLGYENRPALLLGMDALRRFERVQIDFGARKVRFDVPIEGRLPMSGTQLASR